MKTPIAQASLSEWIAQEHPDVDAAAISDTIADWLLAHQNATMRDGDQEYWESHDGQEAFAYLAKELTRDANKTFREQNRG